MLFYNEISIVDTILYEKYTGSIALSVLKIFKLKCGYENFRHLILKIKNYCIIMSFDFEYSATLFNLSILKI